MGGSVIKSNDGDNIISNKVPFHIYVLNTI
jgi:hypothetical protein